MKSPEKICSVCGDPIIRSPKVWKDTPGQADVYCSPDCIESRLLSYIQEQDFREYQLGGKVRPLRHPTNNPIVSDEYPVYSYSLKKLFRSQFEVLVAKYFIKNGIEFWYEKVTLNLFDGTKHWTPDFYIPAARTFVEVKGVWALGGRKKYLEAVRTIEEPIILIPYWMKELFR